MVRFHQLTQLSRRGFNSQLHLPYSKAWLLETAAIDLRPQEAKPCCKEDVQLTDWVRLDHVLYLRQNVDLTL